MKTVVLAVFVFGAAVGAYATSVHYGNELSDFYPEISAAAVAIPPEIPLEKDVTVWSEFRNRKATLVRSDATKIPL
jgi:hypothetical protein